MPSSDRDAHPLCQHIHPAILCNRPYKVHLNLHLRSTYWPAQVLCQQLSQAYHAKIQSTATMESWGSCKFTMRALVMAAVAEHQIGSQCPRAQTLRLTTAVLQFRCILGGPHPDLAPSQKLKGQSCWDPGMSHVHTTDYALLDNVQMATLEERQLDLQVLTTESGSKTL